MTASSDGPLAKYAATYRPRSILKRGTIVRVWSLVGCNLCIITIILLGSTHQYEKYIPLGIFAAWPNHHLSSNFSFDCKVHTPLAQPEGTHLEFGGRTIVWRPWALTMTGNMESCQRTLFGVDCSISSRTGGPLVLRKIIPLQSSNWSNNE